MFQDNLYRVSVDRRRLVLTVTNRPPLFHGYTASYAVVQKWTGNR